MKIVTDERCAAYSALGHPERPARITRTLELLRSQKDLALTWAAPLSVTDEQLLCAHSREHVEHVKTATDDFDGDTPIYPDIYEHARRSVGGALQALKAACSGEPVFSLMRPPGHHSTRVRAMGFCYFNSIAIAVLEALATGTARVAVYDFDVHHGNGTEAILLDRSGAYFASVHQYPCYPGTGTRNVGANCFNFPVEPQTPRREYRKVLDRALEELLKSKPDLLAVSAGFDAYAHDPIAQETLEEEDFHWLGGRIRKAGLPTFSLLEGGYSNELPALILAYLKGIAGK